MINSDNGWGVLSEIKFIDGLGSFHEWGESGKPGRKELLAGYLVGLGKRTKGFEQIELNAIRDHAKDCLATLSARG